MNATTVLEVKVENIPSELKERAQWMVWAVEIGKKGRIEKAPRTPKPPYHLADSTNPKNHGTFSEACHALQTQAMDGLEFVLTKDDPFALIDLDHVVDPSTEEVCPWAAQIVAYFASYTELSPSGTGLHILVQGELPKANKCTAIELYDRKRVFTMTGHQHKGGGLGGARSINVRQEQLTLFNLAAKAIADALAHFKEPFALLFAGQREEYAALQSQAQDDSREDFQFCLYLATVDATWEEIDAVVRVSGLYRAKWEREDYRTTTIEKAIETHMKETAQEKSVRPGAEETRVTLTRAKAMLTQLGYDKQLWFNAWNQRAYLGDQEVSDRHYLEIADALDVATGLRWPKEVVLEAMELLSYVNERNPLVEWLEGLQWDSRDWLSEFFERIRIKDAFEQMLVRKTLVAMVARALKPGCKVDTVLIFQGYQGIKKSGLIEALCPDKTYFVEDCRILGGKDELMKLRDAWAVEAKELASMKARTVEEVKGFFSQTSDTYRDPFGRKVKKHPRHCVFFGSTNDDEFLRDATGNRRFWVVRTWFEKGERIPLEWVEEHREKLFAQVVSLYHGGEQWWLDPAEDLVLDERNREFEERDPWEPLVLPWALRHHRFRTEDAMELIPGLDYRQWDKLARARVSNILKQSKFKYQPFRGEKRWYHPNPEKMEEPEDETAEVIAEAERIANAGSQHRKKQARPV